MSLGPTMRPPGDEPVRPWYREPWPWVLIAIPAAAVIASLVTLYLALANPEVVVLDLERYEEIRAELRGQSAADDGPGAASAPANGNGDR